MIEVGLNQVLFDTLHNITLSLIDVVYIGFGSIAPFLGSKVTKICLATKISAGFYYCQLQYRLTFLLTIKSMPSFLPLRYCPQLRVNNGFVYTSA